MILSHILLKTLSDISMQKKVYLLWLLQIETTPNFELQF